MYKTRLQELCQKKKWELPKYTTAKNGPPHIPRFTATVNVQALVFETPEEFKSGKEAQNSAARIAYHHFNLNSTPELMLPTSPLPSYLPIPSPGLLPKKNDANTKPANGEEQLHKKDADTQTSAGTNEGFYKNLLQEFTRKKGLPHPSYETVNSGMSHRPIFVSAVAIGVDTFRGEEAKTKKQANINAAKVAYLALTEGPDLPAESANASLQQWKTVVVSRELNWPIPEHATVKPCTNEQWVVYRVKLDKEVAA